MRKPVSLITVLLISFVSFSQSYKLTWGEEMKVSKATSDLNIVAADNTGLYVAELRLTIGGASTFTSTLNDLKKLDKNFAEVFTKDYRKELKGLDFHSFQVLGSDLYMFATDYERKSKLFKVYGAKVDKNSGDLVGELAELGSYELESKKDDYEMKVAAIRDGKSFLMVSNISGKEKTTLGVSLLDKNLVRQQNMVINIDIDPDHYTLEDVKYTSNNKLVVLGKEFEETQIGNKKRKKLIFKQYAMTIYNNKGMKEKDIPMNTENRYFISGKLIEKPTGEMLLAGFYSNGAKKTDLSGFFINRVDPDKGQLLLSSFKEINAGLIGNSFTDESDDDDESKEDKKMAKKAKDDGDDDEFPNEFTIKTVDINPADNSIIITSEVSKYAFYTGTSSTYSSFDKSYHYTTTTIHKFINQDILMISADKDGNIKWLNELPKSQLEQITSSHTSYSFYSRGVDNGAFFAKSGSMPYYSSYCSLINNNDMVLILNDHISNNTNAAYGDKVKAISNFKKKSNLYGISVDLATGKMTRKVIAPNSSDGILMPRHGFVVKNEFFVPSVKGHAFGRTDLKFAKITVR